MPISSAIMNTYGRLPVTFVRGEGVWLFDNDGNKYLDAISGIGVNALGHAHPAVTEAICEQAGKLLHTSNLYHIGNQQALADKLVELTSMTRCFFSNSGAEANEAAIKLARLYGHQRQIECPTVVTFTRSFHGRTMATLTATGNEKIKQGFGPLVDGFIHIDYNDIEALKTLSDNPHIVAVLIEPVQGEGGIHIADDAYLSQVHQLCKENDWLMMLDEVQSGNGRTGQYFCYQHFDWMPDVVTTAKGLGNGVPIGACLAQGKAAELFQPGHHGSTYGGNPLACAAALATVNSLVNDSLIENAATMGHYILEQLSARLKDHPIVTHIRGCGLMIGIELNQECSALVQSALNKHLLINVTYGNIVRLLPPLIIQKDEADLLIETLSELIQSLPTTR